MVAIVTGGGLGLERSSGWILGSKGMLGNAGFGRYGENVYVNAATGNLAITRTDEILIGQGPDSVLTRAYNSLGDNSDDNGDHWRMSAQRQITNLSGGLNASGGKVERVDWDGSHEVFTWDTSRGVYTFTGGAGAIDTLAYNSSDQSWLFTDGSSQATEHYTHISKSGDAYFARIDTLSDTDGNTLTYAYDTVTGMLNRVTTTVASGVPEYTLLKWWPGTNDLKSLETHLQDGTVLTRTSYVYDAYHRLQTVTTDLSPNDSSTSDNNAVVTTYTYDDTYDGNGNVITTSNRVHSISQTGGALLIITYDDSNRVDTLTQTMDSGASNITRFSYDTAHKTTTITDQLGQAVVLTYDASNRLKSYTLASGQNTQFTYDSVSDNLKWIDPGSNTTYYEYDTNNNLIRQQDAAGNVVTYTYNSATNALLSETRWYGSDPTPTDSSDDETKPHKTRYVYDSENHLRFVISPLGEVIEYQYYGSGSIYGDGNRKDSFVYRDQTYSLTTYSLSDLTGWADGLTDKSSVLHSHMTYDIRGNLWQVTSYEAADTTGAGTGTTTTATYTYDQYGNLLTRQISGINNVEHFFYDGLGRLYQSVDLANLTTNITFDDSNNKTTVQLADGLQKISTYNYAGQLISYKEHGSGLTNAITSYAYDALGRLLMVTDAKGYNHFYLRDNVGRITADIATNSALTDGTLIEYGYNANDQLVKTVHYANRLTSTQLAGLLSGDDPANPDVSTVRPAADDAHDVWQWRIYDAAHRLVETLDSAGDATVFTYDGASNLLSIQGYADVVNATTITGYKTATPTVQITPTTISPTDILTRNFYDADGRLVGVLDGNGYLTQYRYDAANEKIETIAYATQVTSSTDRASGDLTQLLIDVGTTTNDRHTRAFYDDRGLLRVTLDSLLRPCEYKYDSAEHLTQTIEYAGSITSSVGDRLSDVKTAIAASGLAANSATRNTWHVYDTDSGRLAYDINSIGAVTGYSYDDVLLTVKTTQFATPLTTATLPTQPDMISWASGHTALTDRITRTIYDLKGRVAYTIDGNSFVTAYSYDLDNRKIAEIRYADACVVDDSVTESSLDTLVGTTIPSTAIQTTYVYNFDDTLKDSYDGENVRTHYAYDGLGRVAAKTVAYGTSDASLTTYAYDAGRLASETFAYGTPEQTVTTYAYNGMGELTDKVQGFGSTDTTGATTTHYDYDAGGRLTAETAAYGTSDASTTAYGYNAFGEITARTRAWNTNDASVTLYDRDSFGRVTTETAGSGVAEVSVTTFAYDAFNAITDQTVASNSTGDASTTHFVYDNAGRLKTRTVAYQATGEEASINYTYDAFDDTLTVKDALNYTTTYTYDNDGNLTSVSRPIDATTSAVTTFDYDTFGNLIRTVDPRNTATYPVVSYFFYDKRNLQTLAVDQEGYATGTAYNARGEVISVTRYFTKITAAITPGVAPSITTNTTQDATTSFLRDYLGRVTKITDAEGFYEQYTYDDLGNRLTSRNKLGGIVTYTYTKRGQVKTQSTPMQSVNPNGTIEASTVVNNYSYDRRGNRTQMVEAAGLTEQRTTNYTYDKLDRLTTTTHDQVQVVANDLKTVSTVTPTETKVYNARGEVIETIDAGGGKTFFYYDHRGNRTWQVNAAGTLTKFVYFLNDTLANQRVYGDLVTLPSSSGGTPPSPVSSSNYRLTSYTYDRSRRLLTTTVASLFTGHYDTATSTYGTTTANVTVTNVYDLNGNLVQQTDGNGNSVFYYYDKLGRKIAQADQENYFTFYYLDADGNVTQERRFFYALATTPTISSDPAALRDSLSTTAWRVTNFTYDRNGRRLTESRTGTATYSVDRTTGALTQNTGNTDITITYAYNGLGEVTRKTEANNIDFSVSGDHNTEDYTAYGYDNFGRQTSITKAQFTGYDGNSAQSIVTESYDGLNNLVRTVEGDRATTYSYGAGGRLASTADASGFTTNFGYDAAGRTVKASYTRLKSDGTTQLTEAQATRYDILGRVTFQAMASYDSTNNVWTFGDSSQTQYNSYGEVSARGLNGMWQETYFYDAGGRMWKSTVGDGTTRVYFYDGNGKQTLTIASSGAALPTGYAQAIALLTNNGASTIGAYDAQGLVVTINVLDKRGQVTQTREPLRQLSGDATSGYVTATITHGKTYNAFGEVTSETDARGNVTNFVYDRAGRLVSETGPSVSYTDENGGIYSAPSVKRYYYDLSGRLVGVVDANHSGDANPLLYANTRVLLSGTGHDGSDPLVLKEFHPDGGMYERKYDKYYDLRTTIDEVLKTESYVYDAKDRLIEQDHQVRTSDTGTPQLKDYYSYDGLGHRMAHWNNFYFNTTTNTPTAKDTTDYDRQGRVVSMVDMGGNTTTYGYAWSNGIATTGLGTFGGWTKTTVNSAGRTATEKTDYFGRLVDKVDSNDYAHDYNYTFDLAGRLTHLTMQQIIQGTPVTGADSYYTYFNTGRMAFVDSPYTYSWYVYDEGSEHGGHSVAAHIYSSYAYDVDGNRTYEHYEDNHSLADDGTNPVAVFESATVTYDALGRMTHLADSGVTIDWEYDLNSNIRHMAASYYTLDDNGGAHAGGSQDFWYKYDSMNRFVLTKGTLSGSRGSGTIVRGTTGTDITYNQAGQRATATHTIYTDNPSPTADTYQEEKETYSYTEDGYLERVDIRFGTVSTSNPPPAASGAATRWATYGRDAMGRVTGYSEFDSAYSSSSAVYSRTATYNSKSQVTEDVVTTVRPDTAGGTNHSWVSDTTYDYNAQTTDQWGAPHYNGAYQGGVVTHSSSTTTKDGDTAHATTSDTVNGYTWFDDAQQFQILYTPDVNQPATYTSTTFGYEYDGRLANIQITGDHARTIDFTTNAQGEILSRRENAWDTSVTAHPSEIHYYFNGVQVGDVSNNGTSDIDYAASIAEHRAIPSGGSSGVTSGYFAYGMSNGAEFSNVTTGTKYADFDQSYDPINGLNYESTSSRYTVQSGDTLDSIALQIWGDASFWYMLADANGLNGSETLVAGQDLIVPNKVHNTHNSSDVFKVYDPNKAIGNVTPGNPVPHGHQGCGVFGEIILVAIAVAVTILTEGALAEPMGEFAGTLGFTGVTTTVAADGAITTAVAAGSSAAIAGGVMAGAIAGVAGSAVSQGVGLALGIQKSFDWKSLALSAISGGVEGGLAGADLFGKAGLFSGVTDKFEQGLITGTLSNLATQGIALATGVQSKFDWAGVAAAGITSGVTNWASGNLTDIIPSDMARHFVSGMAGGIAGAAARTLITGTDFGDNLIAVLPSVIGATIGTAIAERATDPSETTKQAQNGGAWTGDPYQNFLAACGGGGGGDAPYGVTPVDFAGSLNGQYEDTIFAPDSSGQWIETVIGTASSDYIFNASLEYANNSSLRQLPSGVLNRAPSSIRQDIQRYFYLNQPYAYSNNHGPALQRVLGGLQMLGATGEGVVGVGLALGGVAGSETGAGIAVAVGGAAMTVNAVDNFATGWDRIWTGQPQQTGLNKALVGLGLSPMTADVIESGLDGLTASGAWRALGAVPASSSLLASEVVPNLPALIPGGKTLGIFRASSGDVPLTSGWDGPSSLMPPRSPGFDIVSKTHVEGHAAALMHQQGLTDATLFINNPTVCSSCVVNLPRMLPPGATLRVVLPDGTITTFTGR